MPDCANPGTAIRARGACSPSAPFYKDRPTWLTAGADPGTAIRARGTCSPSLFFHEDGPTCQTAGADPGTATLMRFPSLSLSKGGPVCYMAVAPVFV
jgi:hypothetical protein